MERIAREGGALVFLQGHEGRGIGLAAKISAYALQDNGADTVAANELLGLPVDARSYTAAASILQDLGMTRIRLLTNNPAKQDALVADGIEVKAMVPLQVGFTASNRFYIETKRDRMGHTFSTVAVDEQGETSK
jgi:3,4-dihydroxy 2-butanone 4-phosphate synthase/GTP cyclohydrolase II